MMRVFEDDGTGLMEKLPKINDTWNYVTYAVGIDEPVASVVA